LNLPWLAGGMPGAAPLRVMTFNIHEGRSGSQRIRAEVRAARPDLLLLVEAPDRNRDAGFYADLSAELPGYQDVQLGEFYLASRWPLREARLAFPVGCAGQGLLATVEGPASSFRVVGIHLSQDPVAGYVGQRLYAPRRHPTGSLATFRQGIADRRAVVRELQQ